MLSRLTLLCPLYPMTFLSTISCCVSQLGLFDTRFLGTFFLRSRFVLEVIISLSLCNKIFCLQCQIKCQVQVPELKLGSSALDTYLFWGGVLTHSRSPEPPLRWLRCLGLQNFAFIGESLLSASAPGIAPRVCNFSPNPSRD